MSAAIKREPGPILRGWRTFTAAWRVGARNRGRFGHLKTLVFVLCMPFRLMLYSLGVHLERLGGWLIRTMDF